MELPKEHFRHALLLFFNQKKTEDHRILIETYGNVPPSIKTCEYWFRQFKSNDFNVNDKDRSRQKSLKMQICKRYWTKIEHNSLRNLPEN